MDGIKIEEFLTEDVKEEEFLNEDVKKEEFTTEEEDVKFEVFPTEDVEEEIKTKDDLMFDIAITDGILDFQDKKVYLEKTIITKDGGYEHHNKRDVEASSASKSSSCLKRKRADVIMENSFKRKILLKYDINLESYKKVCSELKFSDILENSCSNFSGGSGTTVPESPLGTSHHFSCLPLPHETEVITDSCSYLADISNKYSITHIPITQSTSSSDSDFEISIQELKIPSKKKNINIPISNFYNNMYKKNIDESVTEHNFNEHDLDFNISANIDQNNNASSAQEYILKQKNSKPGTSYGNDSKTKLNIFSLYDDNCAAFDPAERICDVVSSDSDSEEEVVGAVNPSSTVNPSATSNIHWKKITDRCILNPLQFVDQASANTDCSPESPLAIFKCLFSNNIVTFILTETNFYGKQLFDASRNTETPNKFFRAAEWKAINVDEFFTYLGIIMFSSIKPLFNIKDYWATGMWGEAEIPKNMSRDRYLDIDRCFHFWNAGCVHDIQGQLKLSKIKHLLNLFKDSFGNAYSPGQNLSLDESLVGWKSKLSFKTYNKSKHTRYGTRLYALCESSTGYFLNFIVYTGEDTPINSSFGCNMSNANITEKVVCALIEPYLNKGHTLYMDNYYNSPMLALFLRSKGITDVVGTFRSNRRNLPIGLAKHFVSINEKIDFIGHGLGSKVLIQKWVPKKGKNIYIMTTKHSNEMVAVKKYNNIIIKKPQSVTDYNKYMGGVDKVDQMLQPFKMERPKGMRCTQNFFKRCLNIAVLNSYIIYTSLNKDNTTRLPHTEFRKKLVEEIFHENKTSKARSTSDQFEGINHVLKSTGKRRNCWYCPRYRNLKKKRTVWICTSCNGIQLCKEPCFVEFHRKLWAGQVKL